MKRSQSDIRDQSPEFCKVWQTFQSLKQELIMTPVLKFPNFMEPYILTMDDSMKGLGAVLLQTRNGKLLLYLQHMRVGPELEALAVVWALKDSDCTRRFVGYRRYFTEPEEDVYHD